MDPRDTTHQPLLHQRSLLLESQEKKRQLEHLFLTQLIALIHWFFYKKYIFLVFLKIFPDSWSNKKGHPTMKWNILDVVMSSPRSSAQWNIINLAWLKVFFYRNFVSEASLSRPRSKLKRPQKPNWWIKQM